MLLFCDKQSQKAYVLVSTKKTLLLVYATCCLGEARLGSRHVAPLLHNRLLDLPGVLPGPGAHFLGDVDTLLLGLEQRNKLGDVLARLLGLEVASFLRDFLNNGLFLVKAFLGSRGQDTAGGAAKLTGHLLTLSLRGVLADALAVGLADLLGPFGALLLGGVTLSDIFTLLFLDGLALDNIIFNLMFVITGVTLRFVDSLTLLWALSFTNQGSVTEFDGLIRGNLLVVNETALDEVLLTFLFLLRLEVSGVGRMTLLAVAMLALNDIIILSLLNHDNLVNASLTGGSNRPNVQGYVILAATLASITGWKSRFSMISMFVGMIMVVMIMSSIGPSIGLIEWESTPQVLALPVGTSSIGTAGCQNQQT